MPLYKRTPFSLAETPEELDPRELVFQVRFTKEIFKDYTEYLKRLNLYRQRLWTCKITGKSNLTYEEALVSEKLASEKVQQFPKELIAPVLHVVQFSTLKFRDLLESIYKKLHEHFSEGDQLYGKKQNSVFPCKILKVFEDSGKTLYKVGWINKDKNLNDTSVVKAEDLTRKKFPFSREALKAFIRESTSQSLPWIINEKLAEQYGISTELPKELQEEKFAQGKIHGCNKARKKQDEVCQKKRKKEETKNSESMVAAKNIKKGKKENSTQGKNNGGNKARKKQDDVKKRKNQESKNSESMAATKKVKKEEKKPPPEPIKYPIDDLLVQPAADDPVFTDRPSPARDFAVPMDCVGDLLMIWDFCYSFNRMLQLWPFSLEDFQNAVCHKDSNLVLIVESHSAILRLLIKDKGEYFTAIQSKSRSGKITAVNWTNYLCDFIELQDAPVLSTHVATIKRGHYGLLNIRAKLDVLRELVSEALVTDITREQLDEYIEQRQALASRKREEALEEGKKRKKDKEIQGIPSGTQVIKGHVLENGGGNMDVMENGYDKKQNGHVTDGGKDTLVSARKNISGNRKNPSVNTEVIETATDQKGAKESLVSEDKGANNIVAKKNKEQRKKYHQGETEKQFIRTNSLGKDKNYNRYWFFARDGRIFVESPESNLWGYYSSTEELDALIGSLNPKGVRERALQNQLRKSYNRICSGLQKRSRFIAHKIAMDEAVVRRSTRVQAPRRDNPALAFLDYVNRCNTK